MSNKIATAYVQIVPTTKDLKNNLTKEMGADVKAAGTTAGNEFGGSLTDALSKISLVAVATKLATEFGQELAKIIKQSVEDYSNYEQLTGGTEILFKKSSEQVKAYADEAYKTAGISANDYLETVNQFSASLISSLHGDTKKAAELSNQAIMDMSDNANTFGTDMTMIQNAYRGFARQNYTMLDNLSLGFAGTKEGMQDLLKMAQGISKQKFDINNLSDVIEAIHIVQTQMGITGKTAEESANTIEGSFKSLKASMQNLSVEMGKTEGDVSKSMKAVGESGVNYLNNLVPTVQNIVGSFSEVVTSMANELHNHQDEVVDAVSTIIATIVTAVAENREALVELGHEIVEILIKGIIASLPKMKEAAPQIVEYFVQRLLDPLHVGYIQNTAGVGWITALVLGLDTEKYKTKTAAGRIAEVFRDGLKANTETATNEPSKSWATRFGEMLGEASYSAAYVIAPKIATKYKDSFIAKGDEVGASTETWANKMKDYFDSAWKRAGGMLDSAKGWIVASKDEFVKNIGNYYELGRDFVTRIKEGFKAKWNSWINSVTDALHPSNLLKSLKQGFTNWIADTKGIGRDIVDGIYQGIKNAWNQLCYNTSNLTKQLVADIKKALGIKSPSKVFAQQVGQWIPKGIAEGIEKNMNSVTNALDTLTEEALLDTRKGINVIANGSYTVDSFGTTGTSAYNQTINVYSPKALSPSEIARQTRNNTRNMVLSLRGV